jgi:hypothetical protein
MPCVTTAENALGQGSGAASLRRGSIAASVRASVFAASNNVLRSLVASTERPTEIHNLHDIQMNDFKEELSCFL